MDERAEFDDERRALFGANAAIYGDGRPGYPAALFEHLVDTCGLGPDCDVLEIGPGSGQATADLVASGANLTAIEPAQSFCDVLAARFGDGVTAVRGDFEELAIPPRSFDLVAAATSFHWIEPARGLAKVAELLRPGGSVALWWTCFGDVSRPDPFRTSIQPLLHEYAPQFADDVDGGVGVGAHPYALDVPARLGEIDATGRFGTSRHIEFPWRHRQTAAEVRVFFASFSGWMALAEPGRTTLLDAIERLVADEFGGVVDRPFVTALYHARVADG